MAKVDWPVKTLGEVAELNPSEPALSDNAPYVPMDAVSAGKRQVQYTQPRGQRSGARARAGDILFARITPCLQNGKVALIQDEIERCGGSTEFIVVRAGPDVLRGFLYQWITAEHVRDHLTALMKGTTGRQRLDARDLASTELPVPPLEEQKRIVALLDDATARITELTACYERARTHANDLFTSALRDALESNPDWPVKTLGDVCKVFDDGDWIESKDQATCGVRLIQTGNVGDGEFKDRFDKARFISESTFSRLRCTEIFPGDLLVSRLPDPVGRACLIPDTGSRMITAVDCTIMRTHNEIMMPQFLVLSTQTTDYREQVRAKITGTTRDRISRSNLAEVKVLVPTLEEQKRIVARLDQMRAKTAEMVAAYDAKLQAAKNLRQSILEAAFAGDL